MKLSNILGIGAGVGILGFIGYKLGWIKKPELKEVSIDTSPPEKSVPTKVEDISEPSVPGGVAGMQVPAQEGGVVNLPPTSDMTTPSDSSGGGGGIAVPTSPAPLTTAGPTGHAPPKAAAPKHAPPRAFTPKPVDAAAKAAAGARGAAQAAALGTPTPSGAVAGMAQGTAKASAQAAAARITQQAIDAANALKGIQAPQPRKFTLLGFRPPAPAPAPSPTPTTPKTTGFGISKSFKIQRQD